MSGLTLSISGGAQRRPLHAAVGLPVDGGSYNRAPYRQVAQLFLDQMDQLH